MRSKERKDILLDVLVKDFVQNNEPLSSKGLVEKTGLKVSSATVRNDLLSLEKEGFVKHVHTSSGRIPTDKGYRYFVDHLMKPDVLSLEEHQFIVHSVQKVSTSVDHILVQAGQVLAQLSNQPVVIVTESFRKNVIRLIQLVLLNIHQVLVIILDNYGEHVEELLELTDLRISQEELNKITEHLNYICQDCQADQLGQVVDDRIDVLLSRFSSFHELLDQILQVIRKSPKALADQRVYSENKGSLLSYPEFQQIENLKLVSKVLEDENRLSGLFQEMALMTGQQHQSVQSVIGTENPDESLSSTSIVYGKVDVEGQSIANIGLVGPTRTQYDRLFNRMTVVLDQLRHRIRNLFMN